MVAAIYKILGYTAGHVPEDVVAASPQIPWARMRGMRDLAVHEYFGIDANILWDTVWINLSVLLPLLRELLEG